jgi:hypothetical protein
MSDQREKVMLSLPNRVLCYYQPIMRLTAQGRTSLSAGKMRHGRLRGINAKGQLRIRYFGVKCWSSFAPCFWEFDPDQTEERKGVR